jgi:hypothetical protein
MKTKLWLAFFILLLPVLFADVYKINNITVNYLNTQPQFVKDLVSRFSGNILNFQKKLGTYPELPIKIIIAADRKDYQHYAISKAKIIEFSQAFYKNGTIYLRNPADLQNFKQVHQILLHEYIHHFVHYYFRSAPLWFHEGMAVYFSNDMNFDREFNFMRNHFLGTSLTLNEMRRSYPSNKAQWQAFYSKAGLAVKYLATKEKKHFIGFWDNAKPKSSFLNIFTKSFYYTPTEFSAKFQKYSKTHLIYGLLIAFSSLIWLVLPFILLLGWFRKYLRGKKTQKEWEAEQYELSGEENEGI